VSVFPVLSLSIGGALGLGAFILRYGAAPASSPSLFLAPSTTTSSSDLVYRSYPCDRTRTFVASIFRVRVAIVSSSRVSRLLSSLPPSLPSFLRSS